MQCICKNCGAPIDETVAYCPYCNAMNYEGAEGEYFRQLGNVKQNLAEMGDDTREEVIATAKRGGKIVLIIMVIIILLVLPLVLITAYDSYKTDRYYTQVEEKQRAWKNTYYPQMDELYKNQEYDELWKFIEEHKGDEGNSAWEWPHYTEIISQYGGE